MRAIFIDPPSHMNEAMALYALEISSWCQLVGMKKSVDYDWTLDRTAHKVVFRLFNEFESAASMLLLKFDKDHLRNEDTE